MEDMYVVVTQWKNEFQPRIRIIGYEKECKAFLFDKFSEWEAVCKNDGNDMKVTEIENNFGRAWKIDIFNKKDDTLFVKYVYLLPYRK